MRPARGRSWGLLSVLGMLVIGALAGGLAGAGGTYLNPLVAPTVTSSRPTPVPTPQIQVSLPVAAGANIAEIYRNASPGVVHISTVQQSGPSGAGTGFVVSQQGLILTNNHVVEGTERLLVRFDDGSEAPARLLGRDPAGDLALIQVGVSADRLVPLVFGDSDSVQPGELAVAIGNPLGLEQTVTAGVVSAVQRTALGLTRRPVRGLIQTDAPINPGNAGGPLLNGRGEVIGITMLGRAGGTSLGFALPINAARRLLPRLEAGEVVRHAYLGIGGRDVNPALAQALQLPIQRGVLVTELASGGPAAKAGLRASSDPQTGVGGDIILAVDGQELRRADDLSRLLDARRPGERIALQVQRGSTQVSVPVVLSEWPG